ncbi:hypothetical protein DSM112329_00296 [Paraconexibacter sp. AEG42_29]|uniref:HTH tetR-type domain-containing protein n=1 Tax=Paraconexibacter sp. AEG42_29 TaxID=2997339 RepID=A0AAU7AP77_9ACTN
MAKRHEAAAVLTEGGSTSAPGRAGSRRRANLPEVILDAALRCFERWGIQRTRVEDIAREADMPRPHIYRHFASKDAIVHAVILRAIDRHHARLAERYPVEGPAGALILNTLLAGVRDAATEVQALTQQDSARITAESLAASAEITAALRAHWEPILKHAEARGELRAHIDIAAATRWLVFIQLSYLTLGNQVPPLEESLSAFVLPALVTPSGPPE